MTNTRVRISAPSRLHFGLLSFGQANRRQFGGMGVALAAPRCELEFLPHKGFSSTGADAARAAMFAERWAAKNRVDLNCEIRVHSAIPSHVGLGSGTQLALSVAAGLERVFERPSENLAALAASVGRGLRSAVGTYAFERGGMVVEKGKFPDEPLAEITCHLNLPEEWRFVLFRPPVGEGLSGSPESTAFKALPPVPEMITEKLETLIESQMVPAVKEGDAEKFGNGLYEYGINAGECFAKLQGGPFANKQVHAVVHLLRDWGIAGVGQSSWGPTVFALTDSDENAQRLTDRVNRETPSELAGWQADITSSDREGAVVEVTALAERVDDG